VGLVIGVIGRCDGLMNEFRMRLIRMGFWGRGGMAFGQLITGGKVGSW